MNMVKQRFLDEDVKQHIRKTWTLSLLLMIRIKSRWRNSHESATVAGAKKGTCEGLPAEGSHRIKRANWKHGNKFHGRSYRRMAKRWRTTGLNTSSLTSHRAITWWYDAAVFSSRPISIDVAKDGKLWKHGKTSSLKDWTTKEFSLRSMTFCSYRSRNWPNLDSRCYSTAVTIVERKSSSGGWFVISKGRAISKRTAKQMWKALENSFAKQTLATQSQIRKKPGLWKMKKDTNLCGVFWYIAMALSADLACHGGPINNCPGESRWRWSDVGPVKRLILGE